MEKLKYTWNDLEKDAKNLAEKIEKSRFKPNSILAISKGGLPLATLMGHLLNIDIIGVMGFRSYSKRRQQRLMIVKKELAGLPGPTLVVDDVVDTGETMLEVKKHYPHSKIAVIHYKEENKPEIKPDYYVSITNAWIEYPWELNDN